MLVPALFETTGAQSATSVNDSYARYCAKCHGADRLGGMGPALIPQNLTRIKKDQARRAIAQGLPATQMPGLGHVLGDDEIDALVEHIYTPLPEMPGWGLKEISGSQIVYKAAPQQVNAPIYDADPLNLFVVVEAGDHHVTVLDGDRFEPIYRFKSRYALHGGPKFSPTGRFVYFASRDGWITKFDLFGLNRVAEIRAGINTRNLAVSSDGRFVIVANYLPHTLVILNAHDLTPKKVIPVVDEHGTSSRVSAVYDAPPRQSFIAALKDLTEVWEIPYHDNPQFYGIVHDYRYEGPPKVSESFPIRRIRLDDYLDDFFFDQAYEHVVGAARNAKQGQVVNLIVGRKIADVDLPGLPHLGSGVTWTYQGRPVLATPNLKKGLISVIDMNSWQTIRQIETLGPGFFMRTHENTRYAWVDVFFGPDRDAVHVIDKDTLELVRSLRPAPGKTAAHVEFTRDGRFALLSVWDMDGAVVVYDAETLAEVKRIPMKKPSGKYNVYNKITRSAGTSH
ncbi:MAG: nitrite reductase [Gammaproteobacteria bacterium]|nr:nitrite reductase [Gammaproteobacteria bacterium]